MLRLSAPRIAPLAALAALAALVAGPAPVLRAQRVDSTLKGRILANLAAKTDSTYHYAAYISRAYADSGTAPLLLVLDPRGRAVGALENLAPAVERLGWVAISSYDTRGDAAPAVNQRIVNVMLADAFNALRLDTARIYVAGLSGTASDAWIFAYGSGGHIAGILSAGAGMPLDSAWRAAHGGRPPFDVALTASPERFGYDAMSALGRRLASDSAPSRLDLVGDAAGWPGEAVVGQALGWLEARAMARGLRPANRSFVDSVFAADSGAAAALEAAHRTGRAADAWTQAAEAWRGTHDVSFALGRAAVLGAQADVKRWRGERDSLAALDSTQRTSLVRTLMALRRTPGVPDLRRLTDAFRIVPLQQWASDAADSVRAEWARRRLSEIYARTSYYEPEAYLAVQDAARALAMLAIASEIRPGSADVCRERARAYALRQDSDRALADLRCALAGSAITVDEIRADPRYRFMQTRDDYLALIGRKPG
ncbi:MAG: hypothetical protein KGN74_00750 [Gemmatimonadota bacterium]|nr:hypothetical protein [Gemmatimonadota bacterium]MDE3171574.1 hypothetical protein [Gemmatimonadota bacterium]